MLHVNNLIGFGSGAEEGIGGNDAFTKLLLHMDGADASTTFTDSSAGNKSATLFGNMQIDTAQSKFGGASALLDGTGDLIQFAASADWDWGTADMTIDFWIRFNATVRQYIYDVSANGSPLTITPSSGLIEVYQGGFVIQTGSTPFNTGQWYHIALVRTGTTFTVYRDGTSYVSGTGAGAYGGNFILSVGCYGGGGAFSINGWLDEFRISKSIARWTANFTPPAMAYS